MLRPVSQSTGISARTHLFGRVRGAVMSAPILRCCLFRVSMRCQDLSGITAIMDIPPISASVPENALALA
jgi:hypothetical protein